MPVPEKYFTPASVLSFQDDQLVERDRGRCAAARLEAHLPRAIDVASWVSVFSGQRVRRFRRRLAEDNKHRAPRLEVASGTVVRPSAILKDAGSDFPVSACHSSGALPVTRKVASTCSAAIAAVVDEVDIAVRQLAMHEQEGVSLSGLV